MPLIFFIVLIVLTLLAILSKFIEIELPLYNYLTN